MKDKIAIGQIISTFGTQGAVFIKSFLSYPEDLVSFESIYDEYGQGPYFLSLLGKAKGNVVKAKVQNINTIEAAEPLIGAKLLIEKSQLNTDIDEDEYLEESLVGCEVLNEQNQSFGVITLVDISTSQHLLEIETAEGHVRLLPFVDAFIEEIDLESKKIWITPPVGWEKL